MSQITRYDLNEDVATGIVDISPVPDNLEGRFVSYTDYAELKAERDTLATENAVVRASIPEERFIDIFNENMDDVSLAEDIGYNTAVKQMRRDIETPATDVYLNSVRAEGVEMVLKLYKSERHLVADEDMAQYDFALSHLALMIAKLRAGKV